MASALASLPGTLPGFFGGLLLPPGSPAGPAGGTAAVPPLTGLTGWEVRVLSHLDYHTLLCQVPHTMITAGTFTKMLSDIGSGSVTLNLDDPFWNTALGDGQPAAELLTFECLWQVCQDGVCRFEFLGETVTEQLTDPSEQRTVTVTGPGTIAMLKWAMSAPQGFPDIILKLDGLADTFDEIGSGGASAIDTNIWTAVSPAGNAYITPVQGLYTYPGGSNYQLSTLYPSGTMTLAACSAVTYLGSSPWDATDTLISCQVAPVGVAGMSTSASTPLPYGTGLDGSELTQMYIQSLANPAYYAMFGLTGSAFYCQLGGPSGVFTKALPAYDATAHAYWMITEQGGSSGGSGTFWFWTSPDGQAWTQQWTIVHNWDATEVALYFTAYYDTSNTQTMVLSNLNSNVSTPSYQGNIYLGIPMMGLWLDQLALAQARGTVPWVQTGALDGGQDSFARPWTDINNVQTVNGTDLYSLLQSCCGTLNADFCMQPGFLLQVGIPEQGAISIGTDRSQTVIFREGRDEITKTRTRVRNTIQNLIGAENSDGREISAADSASVSSWGQREGWYQTAAQVDPVSMEIAAAAAAADSATEILTWTLTVVPDLPGKVAFENFDVGDWVGIELPAPSYGAVNAVRVLGIAVSIDGTGLQAVELTLQSYTAWLEQQLTYIAGKMGGAFLNAAGTTAVAQSRYGTGQLPSYFTPASSLANLSDVIGAGPATPDGAVLAYSASTGTWQPSGTTNPATAASQPVTVAGAGGTIALNPVTGTVSVSAGTPGTAIAPDGGGTAIPVPSVTVAQQGDGAVTVTEANAPPPLPPDTPVVVAGALGIVVGWDGLLSGTQPLNNFTYVQVHVSTASGFTPSAATLNGTMAAGGLFGVGGLAAGTLYYARLVAVNRSQAASTPSPQAAGVPVTTGATITTGSITAAQVAFNAAGIGGVNVFTAPAAPYDWTFSPVSGTTGSFVTSAGVLSGANPMSLGDTFSDSAGRGGPFTVSAISAPSGGNITVSFTPAASTAFTSGDTLTGGTNGSQWFNTSAGNALSVWSNGVWGPYQWGTGAITANSITAGLLQAGIVVAGVVDGTVITGAQIIADGTSGQILVYSGTPAFGNLIGAWSTSAGDDIYGNPYPAGLLAQDGLIAGYAISSIGAFLSTLHVTSPPAAISYTGSAPGTNSTLPGTTPVTAGGPASNSNADLYSWALNIAHATGGGDLNLLAIYCNALAADVQVAINYENALGIEVGQMIGVLNQLVINQNAIISQLQTAGIFT